MGDNEEAARKQSVVDLEELYVWLQQLEDPTIGKKILGECWTRNSLPTDVVCAARVRFVILFNHQRLKIFRRYQKTRFFNDNI
jgi:hypothetical protein